jgi:DNA transformation protein and related proteins
MTTKESTAEYITDQLAGVPDISTRKMFGEYALYCGKKVVALICDEKLFIKITEQGREFVGERYTEGFAYKGAKASLYIDADLLEDREWISMLIQITAEHVPEPKLKKKK